MKKKSLESFGYKEDSEEIRKHLVVTMRHARDFFTEKYRPLSDWDLEVYDPNGNMVGYSYMKNGNVEVVEFDPGITGNYTINIIKRGGTTEKEFVYLAWW